MTFRYNDELLKDQRRLLRSNQTNAEKKLWDALRNRQLNGLKFFRQYSVGKFILDFYAPQRKLVIEVDGGQHAQEAQTIYDNERTVFLKEREMTVVRFWNNEVENNLPGVIEKILSIIVVTPPTSP